jgi:Icc-related predicted phosphoesterase
MKILAVADTEDRALSEHFDRERYRDVELIISCGDLKSSYLDYIISQLNLPLLYVRGNHDLAYRESPPPGCDDLDGRVRKVGGLRIAGLEGSRWYGGKGVEYGDLHMRVKALGLEVKIKLAGGVDVLVTHAPPTFPDGEEAAATDHVHAGFPVFRTLVERYRPKLFLHGHTHLGYGRNKRERMIGETRVIDCYGATLVTL